MASQATESSHVGQMEHIKTLESLGARRASKQEWHGETLISTRECHKILKYFDLISILKYFQEYHCKPKHFSKLCKPNVTSVAVQKIKRKDLEFFNREAQEV
jgi:hypothetical protein